MKCVWLYIKTWFEEVVSRDSHEIFERFYRCTTEPLLKFYKYSIFKMVEIKFILVQLKCFTNNGLRWVHKLVSSGPIKISVKKLIFSSEKIANYIFH